MDGIALIDVARDGIENMALDQYALEWSAEHRCALLRVYRWSEPTLSLGYFQSFGDRRLEPAVMDLPVVRRATGGGAIVHHHEWTYCIALPDGQIGRAHV